MSSPAPSTSAAARGEEVYGAQPLNVIPPKAPKRLGMPKLQLPSQQPACSPSEGPHSSSSRPVHTKLNNPLTANTPGQAPSLQLAIPSCKTFSGLQSDAEEVYEGSAGTRTELPMGGAGGGSTVHGSIYPDTVPHGGGAQSTDHHALTNDLRRAIRGIALDDGGSQASEGEGNGSCLASSTSAASLKVPTSAGQTATSSSSPIGSIASTSATSDPSPAQELEEESELQLKGNMEVLTRLGEGASGEVRKAMYRPTGQIMAMKTISTSPNPAVHRQILRELAFNRTCHSEYIVRYYGAFLDSEDTSIVICMEQCEAGSLDGIYKRCKARNGRMGEKVLAKIAESGLRGLAYLHQRKIIHRDIKPSNILVTRQGQIKLCDFGVSGELIDSMAGTFTGTSYYMAPERIRGLPYTITSDVWSLGLTILELASNRFPFPPEGEAALGPIDLLSHIVTMKVPELKDDEASGVKWSKAFKDFLENCLEKDGTRRYGPVKMLNHPFIKKSISRVPQPNIAKFVADVWGWDYAEEDIQLQQQQAQAPSAAASPAAVSVVAPTAPAMENVLVPGIGRVASIRKAPSPLAPPSRAPSLAPIAAQTKAQSPSESNVVDAEGRTAVERALAKKREADVGLIGSPTEEI